MFDIGWSEMAVIAVVALFVIGPRDLPKVLRTVGRYANKVRAMAREFQSSIDEAVRDAELDEVKKQIESVARFDIGRSVSDTIDPGGTMRTAFDAKPPAKTAPISGEPVKPAAIGGEPAKSVAANEPQGPAAAADVGG